MNLLGIHLRGTPENITRDQTSVARVIDTDTQAPKFTTAECSNGVAKPVVPRVATALLEPDLSDRVIELIVSDQNLLRSNGVKAGKRGDRLAAAVHVGGRLEQSQIDARNTDSTDLAMKLGLGTKGFAILGGKAIDEPEPNVVTRRLVLFSWVAETHQQANSRFAHDARPFRATAPRNQQGYECK